MEVYQIAQTKRIPVPRESGISCCFLETKKLGWQANGRIAVIAATTVAASGKYAGQGRRPATLSGWIVAGG
jgi:Tfp pilus assembly protein PilV